VTGGKERIKYFLDEFNQTFTKPEAFDEFVAGLHAQKNRTLQTNDERWPYSFTSRC